MKEMNETQLHGWRPRRPSRALKSRIFATEPETTASTTWKWSFAAPAMVCSFFAVMMFHFNDPGVLREAKPGLSLLAGNGSNTVHFSDGAQETQNHLAAITFDWTNHTGFQSSIGFTPTTNFSN